MTLTMLGRYRSSRRRNFRPGSTITPTGRGQAQKEMAVNFDALHERARERGWTLSKSRETARYGTMPIRYILKDHKGLMYFRNLDEVERRLNTKANNREPASVITPTS
jgi:hypothetical protein